MENGNIIFGLGSGRSGTSSLAALLDAQQDIVCFHEANPSAMAWQGAEMTVVSLLRDFQAIIDGQERALTIDRTSTERLSPLKRLLALNKVRGMGDVGHYYLPYVEMILERAPHAKFPCLKRDCEETIQSFTAKLRLKPHGRMERLRALLHGKTLPVSRNHWAGKADQRWRGDRVFDACFPSYEDMQSEDLTQHLQRWYDEYYATAARLAAAYPEAVRVFDLSCLNTRDGRAELLEFCLPGEEINANVTAHANHRAVTL